MAKRFVLALALLVAASGARALEYTDVYFDADEPGWGAFLVQSDTLQFVAFFVYGRNGEPVWYTAQLTDDNAGAYTGPVYATTGTWFGSPWNPAQLGVTAVGSATFQPIDLYHATLSYTVSGSPTVNKTIQRQSLTPYQMTGRYSGSMAGAISGCANPARNDPAFRARFVLDTTQVGDSSMTLTFTLVDAAHQGIACVVSGPLAHAGRIYQMPGGTLTCSGPGQDGVATAVTIDALHPTGQGIEGKLSGAAGGACTASLHFAAVRNVND
jgi:hypothetical protein